MVRQHSDREGWTLKMQSAMSKEADKYVSGQTGAERESSVMVMHTGVGGQR
jgi:hypothetical protein